MGIIAKQIKENAIKGLLNDKLVLNAFFLFGVTITNSIAGFLFWTLAARSLSSYEVGVASSIISVILLIVGLANFGLGFGLIRFLPESEEPERLLNSTILVSLALSAVIGGSYVLFMHVLSPTLAGYASNISFKISLVLFVILAVTSNLFSNFFIAYRLAVYSFLEIVLLSTFRIGLLLLASNFGAVGLVIATIMAFLLADLIAYFVFIPRIISKYTIRSGFEFKLIREMFYFSFANYISSFFINVPLLLAAPLALEFSGENAGAYVYIAWMISIFISSPGLALGSSAMAEGSHDPGKSKKILLRARIYSLYITVPLALFFGLEAEFILGLFGRDYLIYSASLLRWLAAASPFVAINGIYLAELRVRKKNRELVISTMIMAIIAVGVSWFMLSDVGIVASGYGLLLSQILGLLILSVFTKG